MSESKDIKQRTLTIERVFDAPIALVWEAWTKAEHILHWWGPKGMTVEIEKHDFEVGGEWKYTMMMPDGNKFISEGKYLEIETHKKIVSTANFVPMTMNVEIHMHFEAEGDQTKFVFSCIHPTVAYCQQQEKMGFYNGWGSTLDRLNQFVIS